MSHCWKSHALAHISWDYSTYRVCEHRRLRRSCANSVYRLNPLCTHERRRKLRSNVRHLDPLHVRSLREGLINWLMYRETLSAGFLTMYDSISLFSHRHKLEYQNFAWIYVDCTFQATNTTCAGWSASLCFASSKVRFPSVDAQL